MPTYYTCASKHSRVRQLVNHIQFKTIALKFFMMNLIAEQAENCSTCLVARDHRSRERPTVLRGSCKNSTDEKVRHEVVNCISELKPHERLKPSGCRTLFVINSFAEGPIVTA
jgi:hypothetical protein